MNTRQKIVIRPRGMGADIVGMDKTSIFQTAAATAQKQMPNLTINVPVPLPPVVSQPASPVFDQAAADAAFQKLVAQTAANTTPWTPDAGNLAKQANLDAAITAANAAKLAPPAMDVMYLPLSVPAPIKPTVYDPQFIPQPAAPPINLPSNTPAAQRILEALSPSTNGNPTTGRTGVFVEPGASIPGAFDAATKARKAPFSPGTMDWPSSGPPMGPLFPSSPPDPGPLLAPDYTRTVSLYPGAPGGHYNPDGQSYSPDGPGGGIPEDEDDPKNPRNYRLPDVTVKPIPWWLIALAGYGVYKYWGK